MDKTKNYHSDFNEVFEFAGIMITPTKRANMSEIITE